MPGYAELVVLTDGARSPDFPYFPAAGKNIDSVSERDLTPLKNFFLYKQYIPINVPLIDR
jgi:hypothetical protein